MFNLEHILSQVWVSLKVLSEVFSARMLVSNVKVLVKI
jgi:hypothetical protein